ncbi:GNAT family N-acetyltransferase [Kitasatospora herbaricolor]|uniref:GNAT family N-acetyltransferase n=1 Tax=Kitasatospora herbaricolor TaxID=68217 RepID=A0ABZ1W9U9_9ACTN|nr:GNAT family N-acetyltransferase [Kitasatospora herbaricolor]
MSSALRLVPITTENVEDACRLSVRPDQQRLVQPVAQSLALAYAFGERAWPRLVMDGEEIVGFLMAFFDVPFDADPPGVTRDGLWRLNVAAGQQGRGVGRFAVEQVAAELRRRGRRTLTTSWHVADNGPEPFYRRLGFRPTGETVEGEIVGELDLGTPEAG